MKKKIGRSDGSRGSDSSSEMSLAHPSEDEESSFFIQKRKKGKKVNKEIKYVESSPNKRFSRCDEKNFSEKHHIAYLGLDNDRGCEIIWNEIIVNSISSVHRENLFNDLKRLKQLNCENLNSISEVWKKEDNAIVLITDSFGGGTIRQYLGKIGKQKLKVIKSWIGAILRSLNFLHKNGILFRDLNCGRIHFNGGLGTLAIGDLFVSSPIFYDSYGENAFDMFPPNCMSPELVNCQPLTEKSDIYSLGMVLIEMISLEIPYSDLGSNSDILQKIKVGEKPDMFERISDENVKQFLSRLLDFDPNKRPTVMEILSDDFLKINPIEDDRIIKIRPVKKVKKKKLLMKEIEKSIEKKTKNRVLYKQDFEENPYFEDSKHDKRILFGDNVLRQELGPQRKREISKPERPAHNNQPLGKIGLDTGQGESNDITNNLGNSERECGTQYSKYYSDLYQTNNPCTTSHFTSKKNIDNSKNEYANLEAERFDNTMNDKVMINQSSNEEYEGRNRNVDNVVIYNQNEDDILDNPNEKGNEANTNNSPFYQIVDDEYNVHLKFLINEDGKVHEIQFTYNLLKDSIANLMEEIRNEFNFNYENLNHIYETLKKVHIYSKFCKNLDLLPDNSF